MEFKEALWIKETKNALFSDIKKNKRIPEMLFLRINIKKGK